MELYSERSTHIRRVLIGIDFSEASLAAARWIARQFAAEAELILVHVIPVPPPPSFCRDILADRQTLATGAVPRLEGGLRGFAATLPSARVTTHLRVGRPFEQIAELAEELRVDLIALGRTGERAGTWKRLGSTADRLIRRVRTPVLIVPGSPATIANRVLAAVDDAQNATAVLDGAHTLARLFGARLLAMHALSDAFGAHGARATRGSGIAGHAHTPTTEAVRNAARVWLRDRIEQTGADPATADVTVSIGDAGPAILAEAQRSGAELIVVGRWGAHALGQAGTGAVTRFVLRGARCPVLIITNGGTSIAPHWNRRFQHALRLPPRASRLRWTSGGDDDEGPPAA
jgi:nucleotide-binding universal stress UspA family protein